MTYKISKTSYSAVELQLRLLSKYFVDVHEPRHEKAEFFAYAKTKVQICCTVTAQQICTFVLAYAKIWFSHDVAPDQHLCFCYMDRKIPTPLIHTQNFKVLAFFCRCIG